MKVVHNFFARSKITDPTIVSSSHRLDVGLEVIDAKSPSIIQKDLRELVEIVYFESFSFQVKFSFLLLCLDSIVLPNALFTVSYENFHENNSLLLSSTQSRYPFSSPELQHSVNVSYLYSTMSVD